jgi:hypothetical protein
MSPSTHTELKPAVLLCIDDNEDVLECEKSFLESFGCGRQRKHMVDELRELLVRCGEDVCGFVL